MAVMFTLIYALALSTRCPREEKPEIKSDQIDSENKPGSIHVEKSHAESNASSESLTKTHLETRTDSCSPHEYLLSSLENKNEGQIEPNRSKGHLDFDISLSELYQAKNFTCGTYCQIFWVFISIQLILVCKGTYQDYKSGHLDVNSSSNIDKFFFSFSLIRSIRSLTARSYNDTNILDSVRCTSVFWIISTHILLIRYYDDVSNRSEIPEVTKHPLIAIWCSSPIAVDIFFWISGFLLGFLVLDVKIKWFKILTIRILRILPCYLFVMVFVNHAVGSWNSGPKWHQIRRYLQLDCEKYWWTNLLFINNLYPWYAGNFCIGQSWYIAVDIHMLVISLVVISLYLKSAKKSWICLLVLLSAALVFRLVVSVNNHVYISILNSQQSFENFMKIHHPTMSRLPPYLVGLFTGFIFNYKKTNKATDPVTIFIHSFFNSKKISHFMFCAGISLMSLSIGLKYTAWSDFEGDFLGFSEFTNSVCVSIENLMNGLAMSLIFLPLLYNQFPILSGLLSSPIFIPISKLSFSIFMIHIIAIRITIASEKILYSYTVKNLSIDMLFFSTISAFYGLVLYALIEFPFNNLIKLLLVRLK